MPLSTLMRNFTWDPFRDFERLFGDFARPAHPAVPPVNVWIGKEAVIVRADLPGASPDAFDVSLEDSTLTLSGKVPEESLGEGVTTLRRERVRGEFRRVLELPVRVDAEKIQASYRDGVLEIRLPRLEKDLPRKIKVS